LNRIARFNAREGNPTAWELEVHGSSDFLVRMAEEHPGNVVVLSGRNRGKIDYIQTALEAGLNVLADKPWIICPADLPKLEAALDTADRKGLIAYDIMTERYEVTSILQRELIQDEATFGSVVTGSEQEPAVFMESVHHLMKTVARVPLLRPPWFFDIHQQGEGLSDVGTHLVDLVQWTLFPGQAIDHRTDVKLLEAKRWPTVLTQEEFGRVTGKAGFPEYLEAKGGSLDYYCNNWLSYSLRGVHIKFNVLWNYEAPDGAGDTHCAVYRGTKSRVEVRQGTEEDYRPELYVVPNSAAGRTEVLGALKRRICALEPKFPGVALADLGERIRINIPQQYRLGHEAHFAQVTKQFFEYLSQPESLPAWEKPNMLAKYYVTTTGVDLGAHH
jgi:predicted dehydrogenase